MSILKHPFQLIAIDKTETFLYASILSEIQVFDINGKKVGGWKDGSEKHKSKIKEVKKGEEEEEVESRPNKKVKLDESNMSDLNENESKKKKKKNKPGPGAPPVLNHIRVLRLSDCGNYLIATTDEDKAALIFQISIEKSTSSTIVNLNLIKRQQFQKRPCTLSFANDGKDVVIGDKFGDVFSISLTDKNVIDAKVLEPILGHVSMLSKVIVKKYKGKEYVITADRDEHIRVSRYPQAFVIERMLFGHKEFVSAIVIPNWKPNRLISGGGDDFIAVWDWTQDGEDQLLQKVNIREYIKDYLDEYHVTPERYQREGKELHEISVSDIVTIEESQLIVVVVEATRALLIFRYESERLEYLETIETAGKVVSVSTGGLGTLFVSVDNPNTLVQTFKVVGQHLVSTSNSLEADLNGSSIPIESREDLYPLYHVRNLRKRGEN